MTVLAILKIAGLIILSMMLISLFYLATLFICLTIHEKRLKTFGVKCKTCDGEGGYILDGTFADFIECRECSGYGKILKDKPNDHT